MSEIAGIAVSTGALLCTDEPAHFHTSGPMRVKFFVSLCFAESIRIDFLNRIAG
jgi:hypothetical protein